MVYEVRPGNAYSNSPGVRPSRTYPNCMNDWAPTMEDSRRQTAREVRPDDAYSNSPGVRPSGFHLSRPDDPFPLLDDLQEQLMAHKVRLGDAYSNSPGVQPSRSHKNCANCPVQAESNDSFYHAGSTEARKQADARSVVRWDKHSKTYQNIPNLEGTIHTPLYQMPDLFTPDESAYYTARRTSCCPRELLMNSDTHTRERTCERRQTLKFDSSNESQGEESVP